jgi:hypothetical protein
MEYESLSDGMFDKLVIQLSEVLPDFGKHLAIDSKAIESFAEHKNKNETADGRRDTAMLTMGRRSIAAFMKTASRGRKSSSGSATSFI